jgi:lysophospholipase L1-like esterase
MTILVTGASFSYGPGSWPELLNATNLSCMDVGNRYIAETTIAELNKNTYNLVIVMWSPFEFDADTDIWLHYESNLATMLSLQEYLKKRGQQYVFAFARPLKVFAKFRDLYNQLENVYPVCLQPLVKEHSWYAKDGVHPSVEAHQYYAKELSRYLERLK